MKPFTRLALIATVAAAVISAFAAPALAAPTGHANQVDGAKVGADHAVFVQTDDPAGNAVVAYHRADDGTLALAGTYPTGGNGGVLVGSVVDHLASQGSLTYDAIHRLLFAVNAGSNTVSVFNVHGDQLHLRQVVASGGQFPVSIAVHRNLVYVLNARSRGFRARVRDLRRQPLLDSELHPPARLDAAATPEFTHTPGQVAFSPNGSQLLVTTKGNGSAVDVFHVGFLGELSPTGRERRSRRRSLRRRLRYRRPPRRHRSGHERRRHVHPASERNHRPACNSADRPGSRPVGSRSPTASSTRRTPVARASAASSPPPTVPSPSSTTRAPTREPSTPRPVQTDTSSTSRPAARHRRRIPRQRRRLAHGDRQRRRPQRHGGEGIVAS